MTIDEAMRYKELYDKEKLRKGMGDAKYGRDPRVRSTKYQAMRDDGRKHLHPARNERMPFVEPKDYWPDIPTKREQVFRHIQLAHLGAEGQLKESVIVRAHDLQVTFIVQTNVADPLK